MTNDKTLTDLRKKRNDLERNAKALDGDFSDNACMIREQIGIELEIINMQIKQAKFAAMTREEQEEHIESLRHKALVKAIQYARAKTGLTPDTSNVMDLKWQSMAIEDEIDNLLIHLK